MRRRVTEIHRLSIPYFPSQSGRAYSDPRLSSNSYMFNEDVNLHLFPSEFSKRSPEHKIDIDPDDINMIRKIGLLIKSDRIFPGEGLTKPIQSFFREVAFHLAYKSRVYFEIAPAKIEIATTKTSDSEKADQEDILILERIPGRIIDLGLGLAQLVPIEEWREREKYFIWIPKRVVWKIGLPKRLGGCIKHWIMQRELIACSDLGPRSLRGSRTSWMGNQYIDILDFLNTRQQLLARTTSRWGWQARSLWHDTSLEYFQLYRHLRFQQSMAILRSHLLKEFNALLERIHIRAKLSYTGLATEEDINQIIESLDRGKIGFEELLNKIR
ncbi:MAG: hypothetical protein ACTSPB_11695 [Candidatus Thorarchaeota archaeon]